ncbi:MAG: methyltransferase domain-containing protein [Chloroflexaceae bacterium]|nr:methyltransferase domain-containing protein [Chloroflexaceae bacterium]
MSKAELVVRLPAEARGLSQTEEYCMVALNGHEWAVRLHDYREMYRVPGLYEKILSDTLHCTSPDVVASLLTEQVAREGLSPSGLTVLEVGAGSGLAGAALRRKGIETIVGIDIIEEARVAARREHPSVYHAYYVEDLCHLSHQTRKELRAYQFNCLMCVSALGLNHVPAEVFAHGYNMVSDGGWVVFNVREHSFEDCHATGFIRLVQRMAAEGKMDIQVSRTYRHRFAVDSTPINYTVLVARKHEPIPLDRL